MISTYREFYSRKILEEKLISFSNSPQGVIASDYKTLSDKFISPDYYKVDHDHSTFHIPISMHPNIYMVDLWKTTIEPNLIRINSIIFAGNINDPVYNHSSNENTFNVLNRHNLVTFLKSLSISSILNPQSLLDYYQNHSIVLIDNQNDYLPFQEYLETLSKFNFFLALPGYIKPTCHNLTEALSRATIPIIQKEYNDVLKPKLIDQKNAIVFNSLEDLNDKILQAFALPEKNVIAMRIGVLKYYEENLTPASVVEKILDKKVRTIYLEAEEESVALLNHRSS
jgi:hypothetical protein